MNIRNIIAVTIVIFATASVAPVALAQTRGPFIGASFGDSTARNTCSGAIPAGATCEKKDTAVGIFVGYQIDRTSAIEAGYIDLGKFTTSSPGATTGTGIKGFELSGVASLPLGARFSLFGKLGVFRWNLDQSSSGTGGSFSESKTGTDITYGFGMRFNLVRSFALRAQYQRYRDIGNDATTGKNDIDVISGVAIFSF